MDKDGQDNGVGNLLEETTTDVAELNYARGQL